MGKPSITPAMSSEFNDFTEESAFALFLKLGGKDVAGVCARFDQIGRETVANFWPRILSRHYPIENARSTYSVAVPVGQTVKGDLVYFGDLFMAEDERGSLATLTDLVRLLHITAFVKWKYDYVYAFLRERDVRRGAVFHYQFNTQIPGVQMWENPPPERSSSEHLVISTREQVAHNLLDYVRRETRVTF